MDGLYLVLLGFAVFCFQGTLAEAFLPVPAMDFRPVYYGTRCLILHGDPYQEPALARIYQQEGAESPAETAANRRSETRLNYLPTVFPIALPFALLPFGISHVLWLAVTAISFMVACLLMFDVAAVRAPVLAGGLLCLTLANSELFLILGNPAGISVSFCVIAVWCLLRERFATMGVVLFALSLMLKPHEAGLVWLYFLAAGGVRRRRALQTLGMVAVLSAPALVWITAVAPRWLSELRSILVTYSTRGDVNDPGPSSMAGHGIGMLINLQTVFSLFRDDPEFYNTATYIVCGVLLSLWLISTIRARPSNETSWLALAPIAVLSMLPLYHRLYDARLLLLAIPACAVLWAEGGILAWSALSLTLAAILVTSGILWAIFLSVIGQLHLPALLSAAAQIVPAPLILLGVGVFYLWIYWRRVQGTSMSSELVLEDQ